jgi:hypothetical protein
MSDQRSGDPNTQPDCPAQSDCSGPAGQLGSRRPGVRPSTQRWSGLAALVLALVGLCSFAMSASAEVTSAVRFPGNPLTVFVGPLGQCESNYASGGNNYYPESSELGDCGFFLAFPSEVSGKAAVGQPKALQGATFGFSGTAGPGLSSQYTPIEQSPVTGAGTEASPYTETTVFGVREEEAPKTEYARITETTTYVNGAPQFTSTYVVRNVTTATKIYFRAIYAGDLYVNGDDFGTGVFLAGPPSFVGGENDESGVLGGFQEAPAPALQWSSFQEGCWNETPEGRCEGAAATDQGIWHDVRSTDEEAHAFNETVDPMLIDNAVGVEWDQLRETGLEAGKEQAFTIINRTQVPSGLQISPANQTLTQGQTETVTVTSLDTAGQGYAGRHVNYTVSGANPQSGSVTLNAAGQAQISYVGHNAGIDTIQLYVDLGGSNAQTPSDPAGTATVTFTPLPPAPNSSYTVQSVHANTNGTITITFVPTQAGEAILTVTVPTGTIARNEAEAARRAKKCAQGNRIKIKGKCRPQTTTVGSLTAQGAAGVPLTLTLKPSGKVLSALKKGKTVHLVATLTYKSSLGGTSTVQTFSLTVKGKKPKKGKHGHRKH